MVTLIGLLAGFLSVVSFLPQIFRIWQTRSAKDISRGMYLIFLSGSVLWLIYGICLHALPVIATNVCISTLVIAILILKYRFG